VEVGSDELTNEAKQRKLEAGRGSLSLAIGGTLSGKRFDPVGCSDLTHRTAPHRTAPYPIHHLRSHLVAVSPSYLSSALHLAQQGSSVSTLTPHHPSSPLITQRPAQWPKVSHTSPAVLWSHDPLRRHRVPGTMDHETLGTRLFLSSSFSPQRSESHSLTTTHSPKKLPALVRARARREGHRRWLVLVRSQGGSNRVRIGQHRHIPLAFNDPITPPINYTSHRASCCPVTSSWLRTSAGAQASNICLCSRLLCLCFL
jgi:hypothetical protein